MLPMLFLISAMMTGSAAICFVGCFIKGFRGMSRENVNTNKFMIHSIDFTLMIFCIIAVFLFILGLYVSPRSSAAVHLIMGGEFTLLFWTHVVGVGILIPLALEVYELIPDYIKQVELREHNSWISGIITTSVLICAHRWIHDAIYHDLRRADCSHHHFLITLFSSFGAAGWGCGQNFLAQLPKDQS